MGIAAAVLLIIGMFLFVIAISLGLLWYWLNSNSNRFVDSPVSAELKGRTESKVLDARDQVYKRLEKLKTEN